MLGSQRDAGLRCGSHNAPDLDGILATGKHITTINWRAMTPILRRGSSMARIAVITDSSADLPAAMAEKAGIVVIPVTRDITIAAGSLAEHDEIAAGAGVRAGSPALPEYVAPAEMVDAFTATFSELSAK